MRSATLAVMIALLFVPVSLAMPSDLLETNEKTHPLHEVQVAPRVPAGMQPYFVGFYEMPADLSGYAGFDAIQADEDLRYLKVLAPNDKALRAVALLDDNVRYIEWEDLSKIQLHYAPNDALYNDAGHYGSKIINGEAAWDVTQGSTAVKVAMVDSGLNKGHEEFAGQSRVLQGWDFYQNDNDPQDTGGACSYHGTHTTGTAGATSDNGIGIAGMSQHSILPVKIFHKKGGGPYACQAGDIAQALKYAGDQGAHVSSNSWGSSGSSTAYNDAVQYSHDRGVIHVAAAGNDGCSNCVSFPWRDMSSITIVVGGTDSNDNAYTSSSRGAQVDVSAPGVNVLSTTSGSSGYQLLTGTSMSTPHVAGVVALMYAVDGGLTFSEAENALTTTAVDLGANGHDHQFGWGRVDASAALAAVGGTPADPQCSDGIDNDGDGATDYPADPGCDSASDNDETDPAPPQCSDGIDNDGDGQTDYPADDGCDSASDDDETDPPVGGTDMHIHGIAHGRQGNPRTGSLLIDVDVFDGAEAGLTGVNVCIDVTKVSTGAMASGCADTAADGRVTFEWSGVGRDTYTTCVTSLTLSGYTWDTAADHASSGSCHTGSN